MKNLNETWQNTEAVKTDPFSASLIESVTTLQTSLKRDVQGGVLSLDVAGADEALD
jgi:hypothetical protein